MTSLPFLNIVHLYFLTIRALYFSVTQKMYIIEGYSNPFMLVLCTCLAMPRSSPQCRCTSARVCGETRGFLPIVCYRGHEVRR